MANPDYAFVDGFDHYAEKGDLTLDKSAQMLLDWTSKDSPIFCYPTAALGGPSAGAAMRIGWTTNTSGDQRITRTVPGNFARCIGGMAWKPIACNFVGCGIQFGDAGTDQMGLRINITTQTISFVRGNLRTGTVVATSAESIPGGGGYIEWDITFNGTTGIVKVWINGALTTLNLTAQNTKSTANAYFNSLAIVVSSNNQTSSVEVDNHYLYCFTSAGGSETILNQPVVETQIGTSDDTAQFTAGPSVLGKDYRTTTATVAPGANQLALRQFAPEANATLNSVALVPAATSAAAKFKAVLYADSSGSPGALIATGSEVIGAASGATLTLPFSSGQSLTGGTNYWIGYITDTSVAIQRFDSTTTLGQSKANTYSSGAPNPAGSMTTGQPSWLIWGNMTGAAANFSQVNKIGDPSLLEYNSSSTVGQKDLLNFPALSVTPSAIHMVTNRIAALKSDGGARTLNLPTKSGASSANGSSPGVSPGTAMGYHSSNFFNDPNTSAPWANAAAVNAAKAGYEIAS